MPASHSLPRRRWFGTSKTKNRRRQGPGISLIMLLPPFLIIKIFSHIIMSFLHRVPPHIQVRLCMVLGKPENGTYPFAVVRISSRNEAPYALLLHFIMRIQTGRFFGGLPFGNTQYRRPLSEQTRTGKIISFFWLVNTIAEPGQR